MSEPRPLRDCVADVITQLRAERVTPDDATTSACRTCGGFGVVDGNPMLDTADFLSNECPSCALERLDELPSADEQVEFDNPWTTYVWYAE